jgi:putative ABC transport system permease protein
MQIIGFTLILMSMLILQLIKQDLLMNWQKTLPPNTPNFFAFNIAPTDLDGIKKQFEMNHIQVDAIYPMIRARLTELNGKPVMEAIPVEARQHNALHRELNISWMWQYPSDNKITSGVAWTKAQQGKALISIEEGLANSLHIKLGDELTFQMAEKTFAGKVSNMRSLQWTSFHPNFFIIFPPGFVTSDAVTYITSFYLPVAQRHLIGSLQLAFPNITVLDVASLLEQIQGIVAKLSQALQYLFFFALGLAALIFVASVQATMDERRETYRLLRILGASRQYIIKSITVEMLCLGLVIVLMSIALSYGITALLLKYVFSII